MFTSANTETALARFAPITLEQLNAKAAMLERLDNKYIVNADVFAEFLVRSTEIFDVLELAGKRRFRYDTLYFDTAELACFHDHQRGRRKRCKIRIRDYCDTHQAYLEVKLKDKRGSTVKKRMKCKDGNHAMLDEAQKCFIGFSYRELYDEPLHMQFAPALNMSYQRMTLVARAGGERLTIDNGLSFWTDNNHSVISDNQFVIETKSRNGNGLADQVLRGLHQHPLNRCSKYCIGLALTVPDLTHNAFKPTIRKLEITQ
jgi:VTC domain